MGVQISVRVPDFNSLGYIPGSKISESYSNSMLSPLRRHWAVVHQPHHFPSPPATHEGSNFFTSSPTLVIFHLGDDSHPGGCKVVQVGLYRSKSYHVAPLLKAPNGSLRSVNNIFPHTQDPPQPSPCPLPDCFPPPPLSPSHSLFQPHSPPSSSSETPSSHLKTFASASPLPGNGSLRHRWRCLG